MDKLPDANGSGWQETKWLAAAEVFVACLIFLAASVFNYLPVNETPYIFLFAWLMFRLRGYKWSFVGFKKPESWRRTILLAIAAGVLLQLASEFIIEPVLTYVTAHPQDLSDFSPLVGNLPLTLLMLLVVWILAAFGEELIYRGFLMNRLADIGNRTRFAWVASLVLVSVLFGLGHAYQGTAGILGSTLSGLFMGSLYLYSRRNLWLPILAHGVSDTVGLIIIYLGLVEI